MKLSKKDKDELRKSVEVLLKASPDNKKIQLSNSTLDELLFDIYVVNKEKGIKVKLPVWSGDFLRKLDLSRVSFENVSWGLMYFFGEDLDIDEYPITDDGYEILEKIGFKPIKEKMYYVDYSNTNAKIDFSKSFEFKCGMLETHIWGCDFRNVDLSNSNLFINDGVTNIFYSNLSNTNIKAFNPDNVRFSDVDFSNNNLMGLELDGNYLLYEDIDSNFANTGVNFTIDWIRFRLNASEYDEIDGLNNNRYKKSLRKCLENNWVGCYLNGKLIKTPQEKMKESDQIKEEYEEYKTNEFADILSSIAEQMDTSSPKK